MKGKKVLKQGKRVCSGAEEAGTEFTVWRSTGAKKIWLYKAGSYHSSAAPAPC